MAFKNFNDAIGARDGSLHNRDIITLPAGDYEIPPIPLNQSPRSYSVNANLNNTPPRSSFSALVIEGEFRIAVPLVTGAAGSTPQTVIPAVALPDVDDFYAGATLRGTSGAVLGDRRTIRQQIAAGTPGFPAGALVVTTDYDFPTLGESFEILVPATIVHLDSGLFWSLNGSRMLIVGVEFVCETVGEGITRRWQIENGTQIFVGCRVRCNDHLNFRTFKATLEFKGNSYKSPTYQNESLLRCGGGVYDLAPEQIHCEDQSRLYAQDCFFSRVVPIIDDTSAIELQSMDLANGSILCNGAAFLFGDIAVNPGSIGNRFRLGAPLAGPTHTGGAAHITVNVGGGVWTVANLTGMTPESASEIRFLKITGSANPQNNGCYPIVQWNGPGATSVDINNPNSGATLDGANLTWTEYPHQVGLDYTGAAMQLLNNSTAELHDTEIVDYPGAGLIVDQGKFEADNVFNSGNLNDFGYVVLDGSSGLLFNNPGGVSLFGPPGAALIGGTATSAPVIVADYVGASPLAPGAGGATEPVALCRLDQLF